METNRIRAEIEVEPLVVISSRRKTLPIEVLATLHNDGEEHYVVGTHEPHSAHLLQVLDENAQEIARSDLACGSSVKAATQTFATATVPGGHGLREVETISIDVSKLADGKRYIVRHTHWGHTAEASFVAVHEPAKKGDGKKPAKKAAKKAVKKTAKKAAKKKAAKKSSRR